ncbi:MAG: hypothetical protein HFI69_07010 [Lachnospiraceae bacterium]|nr:hypothetical protein [Lachnospiraceae bacterium]
MVVEYLEKLYQDLYEKKLNLERDNQRKEVQLKNNITFIKTLEESLDENYESFSPRKVDEKNHMKIESLLREQREIEESIRKIKVQIIDLNVQISELDNIIKIARNNEKLVLTDYIKKNDDKIIKQNILEVQEIERQRIARDMHDSVVQSLTSLVHRMELCTKIGEVDPVRSKLELREMTKNVRDIIQEIREVIYDLRPMSLEDIGLEEAVERELIKIRNYGIMKVSYEIQENSLNLSSAITLTIFRIIREVFNNVLKHAQAEHLSVIIKYEEGYVFIDIEDDGVGFSADEELHIVNEENSGFGISMMQERIYLLGGKINIDSKPGEGTKVKISVPIDKEVKQ